MSLRDELKSGARVAIVAAIGAGVKSFVEWVRTQPLKRAIARRRARRQRPPVQP